VRAPEPPTTPRACLCSEGGAFVPAGARSITWAGLRRRCELFMLVCWPATGALGSASRPNYLSIQFFGAFRFLANPPSLGSRVCGLKWSGA
jgi:hypothetical protein